MLIFPSRGPESLSRVLIEASALGRPDCRDGHRRHPGHHRARRHRAALGDPAKRWRTTCGGCARTTGCGRGSAMPRDGRPNTQFDAPGVVARVERLYAEARAAMKVALLAAGGVPAARVRRPRAPRVRSGARARRSRSDRDADHAAAAAVASTRPTPPSTRRSAWISCRTARFPLRAAAGPPCWTGAPRIRCWRLRAGRRALDLVGRGDADIVHGLGASVLGYARVRGAAPRRTRVAGHGAAGPQPAGPRGIRRHRSLAGAAEGRGVPAIAARRCSGARGRPMP